MFDEAFFGADDVGDDRFFNPDRVLNPVRLVNNPNNSPMSSFVKCLMKLSSVQMMSVTIVFLTLTGF
jgi:hypothetical protein